MNITKGKIRDAQRIVIYGQEGIGKSTFASEFPDPVFIDTEGSTAQMDVARFDKPTSWELLKSEVQHVIDHPDCCRTLVLDTADWAEQIMLRDLCAKNKWDSIETPGYGKGYTYAAEEFGKLLNLLTMVKEKGITVVITAHAQLRKVELPEEMGAYDHWEMKTSKKVAPMLKEWADAVFFARYKTMVVEVDKKKKAQGNTRVIETTHTEFWDAKNRYGLPDEVPFDYKSISQIIESTVRTTAEKTDPLPKRSEKPEPAARTQRPVSDPEVEQQVKSAPAPAKETKAPEQPAPEPVKERAAPADFEGLDPRIPKALHDLMQTDGITMWELKNIMYLRGFIPDGTEIWDFDKVNPGIVNGLIVANWQKIKSDILQIRDKQEIPFN